MWGPDRVSNLSKQFLFTDGQNNRQMKFIELITNCLQMDRIADE